MIYKLTKIKITKLISISCLLFLFSTFAYAQTTKSEKIENEESKPSSQKKEFSFQIEPKISIQTGTIGEYVYQKNNSSWEKLSYLEWEEKNIYPFGLTIFADYKNFSTSFYVGSTFKSRCGNMYDSDWIDFKGFKTTYSINENSLDKYFVVNFSIKYAFQPFKQLKVSPIAQFEYSSIKFNARNGYGWYGNEASPKVSWDNENAVYKPKGTLYGVDYERRTMAILLGFALDYTLNKRIHFGASYLISPYTYLFNVDSHFKDHAQKTGTEYVDVIDCFFKNMKAEISVYYDFTENLSLGISAQGNFILLSLGKNYSRLIGNSNYNYHSTTQGGASASTFEISFGCKYNFLQF
ncbi:omptin family outer membrane protease [Treponema pectinovorum]|uniref:omptin family outer membrane protease n=1 Tax=Treponema pectinovorum TaxID=164 RepID=UPI0011C8BCCE|nr:omptin family outer membrane protease [Treponema pectinovorum]